MIAALVALAFTNFAKIDPPLDVSPVIFRKVHVVPMDGERVLGNFAVVTRNGVIEKIGPDREVQTPAGATVVDCKDELYLAPGLADMHVHLYYAGDLLSYLANGVTTVRNMRGSARHLGWRKQILDGTIPGPTIFTAGPILSGPTEDNKTFVKLSTPAEGIAEVDKQKAEGYDFIKVYDPIPKNVLVAVIKEAHRLGLKVAGHVSAEARVPGVLAARQDSIEHAEQFDYHYFEAGLDVAQLPALAREVRRSGAYVCPTMNIIDEFVAAADDRPSLFNRPEARFTNPQVIEYWNTVTKKSSGYNRLVGWEQNKIVCALAEAGVPLLTGTDTHLIGLVPGFSLHREIARMHEAGLSNYTVLQASTANAGRYLDRPTGQIKEGWQADLILLKGNPLDNLDWLSKRVGVMIRGKWMPQSELDAKMEELAKQYTPKSG